MVIHLHSTACLSHQLQTGIITVSSINVMMFLKLLLVEMCFFDAGMCAFSLVESQRLLGMSLVWITNRSSGSEVFVPFQLDGGRPMPPRVYVAVCIMFAAFIPIGSCV